MSLKFKHLKEKKIMLIPDFTENTDNSTVLYFYSDGKNEAELSAQIEKSYVCALKISRCVKNGRACIAAEIGV